MCGEPGNSRATYATCSGWLYGIRARVPQGGQAELLDPLVDGEERFDERVVDVVLRVVLDAAEALELGASLELRQRAVHVDGVDVDVAEDAARVLLARRADEVVRRGLVRQEHGDHPALDADRVPARHQILSRVRPPGDDRRVVADVGMGVGAHCSARAGPYQSLHGASNTVRYRSTIHTAPIHTRPSRARRRAAAAIDSGEGSSASSSGRLAGIGTSGARRAMRRRRAAQSLGHGRDDLARTCRSRGSPRRRRAAPAPRPRPRSRPSRSSGTSVRRSTTAASMPSAASSRAASTDCCTIQPAETIVTSPPSRSRAGGPNGAGSDAVVGVLGPRKRRRCARLSSQLVLEEDHRVVVADRPRAAAAQARPATRGRRP